MTSRLLIDEHPLLVLPRLAQILGVSEAIVIQQIHYWVTSKMNKNYFYGRYWVYNTYEQWNEQFPFWCQRSVRTAIRSLEKQGALISFVTKDFKKKKYYAIDYAALRKLEESFNKGVSDTSPSSPLSSLDDESGTSLLEEIESDENSQNLSELGDLSMWQNLPDRDGNLYQIDLARFAASYNKDTETPFTETTLLPQTPSSRLIDEEEEEEFRKENSKEGGENTLSLLMKAVQGWERIVHPYLKIKKHIHLTTKRSEKLEVLFKGLFQNDLQKWEAYCQQIVETPFLLGMGTKGGWKVSFDWALEESNAIKVLEDYYFSGERGEKQSISPAQSQQSLAEQIQATCPPEFQQKWMQVCDHLLKRMEVAKFDSWIAPLTPISLNGSTVKISTPSRFMQAYVEREFKDVLTQSIKAICPEMESLDLIVREKKQ